MEQAGDECLDGIAGHLFHDAQNHSSRTQNEGINGKDAEFVALDEVTDQTDGQKAEDQRRRHAEQRRAPLDAHAAGRRVMQIQDAGRQHRRQAENEGVGNGIAAFQPAHLPHRDGGTGAGNARQSGKQL